MYLLYQGNGTKCRVQTSTAMSSSYSISPAVLEKKAKKKKKTGDNIYLSIGDVSGPRQPKCHRSRRKKRKREREISLTIERRKQLVSCPWNRVNQRKRGTDRNRIGRCFRGSCRGEIKRAKADVRDHRTKGEDQILDAAVASLKGEPATTAAFRQDRKYAEFMDARVPPPPRNWDGFLRSTVLSVVPFSLTVYTYASSLSMDPARKLVVNRPANKRGTNWILFSEARDSPFRLAV